MFRSAKEAQTKLRRRKFDIILVDLHLPGDSGVRYLRSLRRLGAAPHLIAYTASEDSTVVVQAFAAGATGYIPKSWSLQQVVEAMLGALAGSRPVDSRAKQWLLQHFRHSQRERGDSRLTETEQVVMKLTRQGLSCAEIAKKMGRSINTVYMHNRRIIRKLGAEGRIAAATIAASGQHRGNHPAVPAAKRR